MYASKQLIVAGLFAAFGTSVFAQEATPDTTWLTPSTSKTRAEVRAELDQARADGTIELTGIGHHYYTMHVASKSRDDVKAELMASKANGEFDAINKEGYGMVAALRAAPVYAKAGSTLAQK